MGDSVRWGPSEQVQLDSAPAIGDVSRTPLQDLVLPEDSMAVSHFLSPKETSSLKRGCAINLLISTIDVKVTYTDSSRIAHLLKTPPQGNKDKTQ